ncbi:transposase domain-containing protein [Streptomyces sclerotialus]|uniref:transposase domain-containing protein n=1 Tax=Streptomyces sclerotialus TaxID=1957 RepID=UPI00099CE022
MAVVAPRVTGWGAGRRVRIGILTKVFTAELVDAATAKHDRAERRRRLLPAPRWSGTSSWPCVRSPVSRTRRCCGC